MEYCSYGNDRWEILVGRFEGPEQRAAEMLYAGVAPEVPYILTARQAQEGETPAGVSLLLLGTRRTNPLLRACVGADEIPREGFLVRVGPSPFDPTRQVAVLAGDTPVQTLYAAAYFLDAYLPLARQHENHIPYFNKLFSGPMREHSHTAAPAFSERGIWTWGHCIYEYHRFAANMARLGLNAVTIWNDYAPLNLRDVVDCFHSYGIRVIFGYSWGWDEGVDPCDPDTLAHWTRRACEIYERDYAGAGGDGIYIQSFTETNQQELGGAPIAETVTRWVNTIGGAMLDRWPELQIQFGLHATSVREHLDAIRGVDPRISIVWEDCGAFPYAYLSRDTEHEAETLLFTEAIAALRPEAPYGVVLKGQVCLDWSRFEHQQGPFILGCAGPDELRRRAGQVRRQWHDVQSYWLRNVEQCRRTLRRLPGAAVYALVEDALLEEACWYPVALFAQLLWTPELDREELLQQVAQRSEVVFA